MKIAQNRCLLCVFCMGKNMRKWLRLLLRLFLCGLLWLVWAVGIEPARLTYPEQRIELEGWNSARAGYKIIMIADLHVGSPHITLKKLDTIVSTVNAMNPDLVVLGGDYVIQGVLGGNPVKSSDIVASLAKLQAKDGVYGILGNHDWWENAPRMAQEFAAAGIPMLEDKQKWIGDKNQGFWLVGVSDYNEGEHNYVKALKGVTSEYPVIAISHSPDIFPELPDMISLLLAGHTHGGQVYIPFIGRPVVPSKYGQRYVMGLKREGSKQIFVSAGVGTSILPVRFMTPPEINILTVYPK